MTTLQREPYVIDGQTFTIKQVEWLDDVFWTYEDQHGHHPPIIRKRNQHATKESAIAQLERERQILARTGTCYASLHDRADYETACQVANVPAMRDEELLNNDGVRYGTFTAPEYPADVVVRMALARRRQMALTVQELRRHRTEV